MVHKWLLRRARRRILAGFILVFILGPNLFTYMMSQPIKIPLLPAIVGVPRGEILIRLIIEGRARVGATIGALGTLFLVFGVLYLLVTVVFEYLKKKRYANRSKI